MTVRSSSASPRSRAGASAGPRRRRPPSPGLARPLLPRHDPRRSEPFQRPAVHRLPAAADTGRPGRRPAALRRSTVRLRAIVCSQAWQRPGRRIEALRPVPEPERLLYHLLGETADPRSTGSRSHRRHPRDGHRERPVPRATRPRSPGRGLSPRTTDRPAMPASRGSGGFDHFRRIRVPHCGGLGDPRQNARLRRPPWPTTSRRRG